MNKYRRLLGYAFLFFLIIGFDRGTKYMMRNADEQYLLTNFLSLKLQYNRGISWGMLHSENSTIFSIITLIIGILIVVFFGYTFVCFLHNETIAGELMVCAGALSNVIDRIWYGGVADFIFFSLDTWSFPIFNVADVFIVSGLGIMLIREFLYGKH